MKSHSHENVTATSGTYKRHKAKLIKAMANNLNNKDDDDIDVKISEGSRVKKLKGNSYSLYNMHQTSLNPMNQLSTADLLQSTHHLALMN